MDKLQSVSYTHLAGQGMAEMDPDSWSGGKQYAVWKSNLSRIPLQNRHVYQEYVSEIGRAHV